LDRVIADVVERELFRAGERGFVLAGAWKLDRRRRPANPRGFGFDSAARRIERRHAGSMFLVWATRICPVAASTADEEVAAWPTPSIGEVRGTSVGAAPETLLWPCQRSVGLRGLPLARPRTDRPVEADVDAILRTRQ
jgi:hypothetical protein